VYKFTGVPKELPGRYCIENRKLSTEGNHKVRLFCKRFQTYYSKSLVFVFHSDHPDAVFRESTYGGGYSLVGHVMHTEEGVQETFACMSYCLLYKGCKSVNFSKEKRICELNNAIRLEHPDLFMKKSTFVYYEKMSLVILNVL
jgi:hypothetical protein